jgi:hypothetical protein
MEGIERVVKTKETRPLPTISEKGKQECLQKMVCG